MTLWPLIVTVIFEGTPPDIIRDADYATTEKKRDLFKNQVEF